MGYLINTKCRVLTILKTGKFKARTLADPAAGEGLFPVNSAFFFGHVFAAHRCMGAIFNCDRSAFRIYTLSNYPTSFKRNTYLQGKEKSRETDGFPFANLLPKCPP